MIGILIGLIGIAILCALNTWGVYRLGAGMSCIIFRARHFPTLRLLHPRKLEAARELYGLSPSDEAWGTGVRGLGAWVSFKGVVEYERVSKGPSKGSKRVQLYVFTRV